MKPFILVVDSDEACRDLLRTSLQKGGYDVSVLHDVKKVARRVALERPALMVIAGGTRRSGGVPALQALQALRTAQDDLPVIMLGDADDAIERIVALECGADDFISKPFNAREVLLRVHTVLRRVEQHSLQDPDSRAPYAFSGFSLDFASRRLTYHDAQVPLTQNEYALLALFSSAPGRLFSKEAIVRRVNAKIPDSNTCVSVWVYRLRLRLRQVAGACQFIETVHGQGFVFRPDQAPPRSAAIGSGLASMQSEQTSTHCSAA
jgi:DNA-binding response OmpR family regulator